MQLILHPGNTSVIELQSLKNGITGSFVNDATVTATIADSSGTPVAGESWPIAMAYVSGSDGVYRGSISHDIEVSVGSKYTATVKAVSPDSSEAEFNCLVAVWNKC